MRASIPSVEALVIRQERSPIPMLDELGVAYHESTHVVVASQLCVATGDVSLIGTLQRDGKWYWDGRADIGTSTVGPDVIAKIAVAGPIADLKYTLIRRLCDNCEISEDAAFIETRLDLSCSVGLATSLPDIGSQRNSDRMYVSATARCRSHSLTHRVFLGDCCGDARDALSALGNNIGRLTEIITDVVSMVNTVKLSVVAIELARALVAVSPEISARKAVKGDHILRLLGLSQNERPSLPRGTIDSR